MIQKQLVAKNKLGTYELTSTGLLFAYSKTTQKVIHLYLTKILNLNSNIIQTKVEGLQKFIDRNFFTTDDFLKKINLLADYIEEKNTQRFLKFISKYFISLLENYKKDIYNQNINDKQIDDNESKTPSMIMLEKFQDVLKKAPPLDWEKFLQQTKKEKKAEGKKETNILPQNDDKNEPSKKMLEKYEHDLTLAPSIYTNEIKKRISQEPLTLTQFYKISIALQKLTDRTKRQQWFSSLSEVLQIVATIYSNLLRERRKEKIIWEKLIEKLHEKYTIPIPRINTIKYKIKIFNFIYKTIQNHIKDIKNDISEIELLQKLYKDLLNLCSDNINIESKKQTLQFLLLPITDKTTKEKVNTKLLNILDIVQKTY